MKNQAPRRYWLDALAKRDAEGCCRVCGSTQNVETAHLSGREHDPVLPCPLCADGFTENDYTGEREPCAACNATGLVRYVRPESIVPLCGPSVDTGTCHNLQHEGALELIPRLSNDEAACMVADVGLERAYRSLSGTGRAPSPLEARRLGEAAA